jgi:hypothetical protein
MNITHNSEFIVVGTICPLTMPDETEVMAYGLVVRVGDEPHMATVASVSLGENILTSQSFVTAVPGCGPITIHCGLWTTVFSSQIADSIGEIDQETMDMVAHHSDSENEDPNFEPIPASTALVYAVMELQGPVLDFWLGDDDEDPPGVKGKGARHPAPASTNVCSC